MSGIVNRRNFLEAAHAYTKASQPTAEQTYRLCASLAQMLSDDLGEKVKVVLPGDNRGKKIARKPRNAPMPERPLVRCAAARDGECSHSQCPQLRDGEPAKSGRHCPHDKQDEDE